MSTLTICLQNMLKTINKMMFLIAKIIREENEYG